MTAGSTAVSSATLLSISNRLAYTHSTSREGGKHNPANPYIPPINRLSLYNYPTKDKEAYVKHILQHCSRRAALF